MTALIGLPHEVINRNRHASPSVPSPTVQALAAALRDAASG